MSWRSCKLGDVSELLSGGTPSKDRLDYWGGDIPWVSAKDLKGPRILDSELHLTEEGAANGTRMVPADTVLFVVRGMSLANEFRVSLAKVPVAFNQDLKALRPRKDVNPAFLFYALFAQRDQIRQLAGEASHGTKKLPTEVAQGIKLRVPDAVTQERIAGIASAYDDLIENNRRRTQLLEQAARLLYQEWFVRLRFPGHEHVKVVDGVPEGWERKALGDLTTKIGSGATPRGGEAAYKSEGITLIRSMNVYDDRFEDDGLAFIDEDQADALSHVTVEPEDILLNITGASVARCCMVPPWHLPARVNQHVMIIRADPQVVDPHFVLAAINSDERKRQLLSYAQAGGTREALTKDMVANFEIVVPSEAILRQFNQIVRDFGRQREVLAQQNAKLSQARDLLLPRLMNGEIAV